MIKITLKNRHDLEQDYLKRMVTPLQCRIDNLKRSLADLLMPASIKVDTKTIKSYNDLTRNVIMIVEDDNKYTKKDYDESKYAISVSSYVSSKKNKLATIDAAKLLAFLEDLSNDNSSRLKELLICPAEQLSQKNKDLISHNSFNAKEITIVCLAITYGVAALSDAAKNFFRKHNLVKNCPYCNYENAEYVEEKRKHTIVTSRVHQLDHFFSQKDHPLLELCMYNLVPSGSLCNSRTCKGEICFNDEFHLNPYLGGFNSDAKFIPVKDGLETTGIELAFFGTVGASNYMKILGDDNDSTNEKYKKGNVNVFKLRGLYGGLNEQADIVLDVVGKRLTGISSNLRFFKKIPGFDWEASHKKWYLKEVRTPFDPLEFNDKPLSKFNRDMHDYYVTNNPSGKNHFLHDLIQY